MTPALAVIDELKKGDWEILFIGRKYATETDKTPSVESEIIPKMGIKFTAITAGRVYREFSVVSLRSLLKIPFGFFQSLIQLIKFRPRVILSFGSYLSVPVVFAGWLLGIPILTHEQTTVKGLATRFNTIFAKRIAVSWPPTVKDYPSQKVVLTGNPIHKAVFKNHQQFWKNLAFEKNLPLIVVTGGNQGSHIINQMVEKILPRILPQANVFHQCGHLSIFGDYEKLRVTKSQLPPELKHHYQVSKYLSGKEMGTLFSQADLVISRAGINTLTELMILGKPAILIPHPRLYQNEQIKNAQMVADLRLAEVLLQKKLTPNNLYNLVIKMLKNIRIYEKNAQKGKNLVKLNAAKKIVTLLEELAGQN